MLVSNVGFLIVLESLFQALSLVDVVGLKRHVKEVRIHVQGRSYCYLGAVLVFLRSLLG